jgi:hypothetical protein
MAEMQEVKCEFCGSIFPLKNAMKVDMETGEYKYACPGCARMQAKAPKPKI